MPQYLLIICTLLESLVIYRVIMNNYKKIATTCTILYEYGVIEVHLLSKGENETIIISKSGDMVLISDIVVYNMP